jgi:hypothetical protein
MEVDLRDKLFNRSSKTDKAREYLKCKLSPLYFIENYVSVPVAGGMIPIRESELWHSTPKFRQFIKALHTLDAVEFMASRQHGKTTTALMYYLHALLFYPKIQIEYVTLDSKRANDAIKRMKEMLASLPDWLQIPFKGKSEKVTYLELENGSRMNSNYVSGSIDPDRLGRGMSAPLIYIDETAFIPKMDIVWTAMQPAISAARVFAKQNNYPNGILFTTTPNGAGVNFFYNVWSRGWDSSEIFEENSIDFKEDFQEIFKKDDEKNNFVRFRVHWSETNKDEEWYRQQIKELNFDMRKVSQELDLTFLGSSNAVFPDEVLETFKPKTETSEITMSYGEKFKLFADLDASRTYLLGVDTAASTGAKADYSSMVLTDAQTGEEVGSWHGKFSVVKRFAVVVKSLIRGLNELHALDDDNLIVIIERNSFGLGVVEDLIYDDDTFDYASYLYYFTQANGDRIPGMQTNAKSRDMMFNLLLSAINEIPERAVSTLLQEELRNLEQKNSGRFEATQGAHDDAIMAYNFCLYVRREMIQDGTIVEEGRVPGKDPKRINYYLDVTMSSASPGIRKSNDKGEELIIVNNDYDDEVKRIQKEVGLKNMEESLPIFENSVIML